MTGKNRPLTNYLGSHSSGVQSANDGKHKLPRFPYSHRFFFPEFSETLACGWSGLRAQPKKRLHLRKGKPSGNQIMQFNRSNMTGKNY